LADEEVSDERSFEFLHEMGEVCKDLRIRLVAGVQEATSTALVLSGRPRHEVEG
jgi:hypothetical protein